MRKLTVAAAGGSRAGWMPAAALAAGLGALAVGFGWPAGAARSASSAASLRTGAATVTATLGSSRGKPPGYFGINYDYGGASVYVNDASVAEQLGALKPGTLRWPAGTGANYFQWQKGYPVPASAGGTGKCAPPHEGETHGFRFTLADLAAAYGRTGAVPIFDLNVMTGSLSSQIDMLKAAGDTGKLPVKYVELGNEFYLCNTDYVQAFPTAQDYGKTVAADVRKLHQAFPGIQVAAVGSADSGSPRAAGWNRGMLSVATGTGKPDAITLHDYPRYDRSLTAAGLPALFTEPYTSAANLSHVTSQLDGTPSWITEYSLSEHYTKGNPAQRTYANALFESEAAILLAQDIRDAKLINYWTSFGPNLNNAYTGTNPTVLTPVGLAMTWLDYAAHDATRQAPIRFSGAPSLGTSKDPALIGEAFSTGTARHEVLVNLSGNAVSVRTGNAIPAGTSYQQVTGNPTEQVTAACDLTRTTRTAGQSIKLARYSMTLAG